MSSMKTKGNILTFRFCLGSVKSCIAFFFFYEESCFKLVVSLSYLYICTNNGEGFAQQAWLSIPLRHWKMAALLTLPPQHPRVLGRDVKKIRTHEYVRIKPATDRKRILKMNTCYWRVRVS